MSIDQIFDPIIGHRKYVPASPAPCGKNNRKGGAEFPPGLELTYYQFLGTRDNNTSQAKKVREPVSDFVLERMRHRPQTDKDGPAIIGAEFLPF